MLPGNTPTSWVTAYARKWQMNGGRDAMDSKRLARHQANYRSMTNVSVNMISIGKVIITEAEVVIMLSDLIKSDYSQSLHTSISIGTTFLLISLALLFLMHCNRQNTVYFRAAHTQTLLKVKSVSPNGQYAFIDIYDMPRPLTPYNLPKPLQVVFDIKNRQTWTLLDTTRFGDAEYFAWSEDSKQVLFNVFRNPTKNSDRFIDLHPIYIYNLQSKEMFDLEKPWTSGRAIPQFFQKENEIIFWSGVLLCDTLDYQPGSRFGRVSILDALKRSMVEIKKSDDIDDVWWMQLYDTTFLLLAQSDTTSLDVFSYVILSLNLSTSDMKTILPEVRVVSKITSFRNMIVFNGRSDNVTKIYVYNFEKESPETILGYEKGKVLRAAINNRRNIVVETLKDDQYWVYVMSMNGTVLDSLKGNSPFWLAGTDTLVYAEEKRISLAYWRDGELKKEIILEVVK